MSQNSLKPASLLLLSGVLALYAGNAHADIKYTTETRMAAAGDGKPMNSITTTIMPGAQRTETRQSFGPVQMTSIELTLCEKRQKYKLDPALKIYTVTSLDGDAGAGGAAGGAANAGGAAANAGGPKGTGKIIVNSSVQDLGEETVADVESDVVEGANTVGVRFGEIGDGEHGTLQQVRVEEA